MKKYGTEVGAARDFFLFILSKSLVFLRGEQSVPGGLYGVKPAKNIFCAERFAPLHAPETRGISPDWRLAGFCLNMPR
jgi:hypothetical protein